MITTLRIRQLLPAFALVAAACSDSNSPDVSSSFDGTVTADLAPAAGEAVAADVDFFRAASATEAGASFALSADGSGSSALVAPSGGANAWISSSCVYNSTTQYFDCPPLSRGGRTHTVSYGVFNLAGASQTAYDPVTTASIRFIVKDTGAVQWTFNGSTFSDTSSRNRDHTVSLLQGDPDTVRAWNGTGTTKIKASAQGQITRLYNYVSNDTITNVRFRMPRLVNPYPLTGTIVNNFTITRTVSGTDTQTRTTTRRVVVTFNGTATATMTIGDEIYNLNLDTHRPTRRQ